jgi:hypothetical protein
MPPTRGMSRTTHRPHGRIISFSKRVPLGLIRRLAWAAALAGFVLLVVGYAPWSVAGKSGQKTFAFPGEACQVLFQAVQHDDEGELEAILGAGKEVTSSGDEAQDQDKLERERFI